MKKQMNLRKQIGMTLMEILASLAIIAAVIVGALSLFGTASSANESTQLLKDITALRTATQTLYMGQGTYGTGVLNGILAVAKKVPGDMSVSGTGTSTTITASNGGLMTITGATSNFTMALTLVPIDQCISLLSNSSSGWSSVQVTGGTAQTTFPVPIATAETQCALGTTITWITTN